MKAETFACAVAAWIFSCGIVPGNAAAANSGFTTQTITKNSDAHSFKGKIQYIDTTNLVITVVGHELIEHHTQKVVVSTTHRITQPKKPEPAKAAQDKPETFQVPLTCKVGKADGTIRNLSVGEIVTVSFIVETTPSGKPERIANEIITPKPAKSAPSAKAANPS